MLNVTGLRLCFSSRLDGSCLLSVLPIEVHRTARHGLLHSEEKLPSGEPPARLTPRHYAHQLVVRHTIRAGRLRHVSRVHQFLHPLSHVSLLRSGSARASLPKVPLLEEIHDGDANGSLHAANRLLSMPSLVSDSVRHGDDAHVAVILHPMQLPDSVRLLDLRLRYHVSAVLRQFLRPSLQETDAIEHNVG